MDNTNSNSVSFVGGPYDGCVPARQKNCVLCGQIAMPVSSNILRLLTGEAAGDETPIRAVARYRLELTQRGPRYRFHCFHSVDRGESKELAVWHHALLAAWNRVVGQQRPR
ncbi:MAG: hypothetical protein WD894_08025 [Pirellulales bacterium]